jgi:hypothetical protein
MALNKDQEEFLNRLTSVTDKLKAGKEVEKAAGTTAEDITGTLSKDLKNGDANKPEVFTDPLRKCFETLASTNKGWAGLGTSKALDDPHAFLRAKAAGDENRYVVSGGKLAGMMETLLLKGAQKEGSTLQQWMDASGRRGAIEEAIERACSSKAFGDGTGAVSKAFDSTAAGPLIREDIAPIIYETYNRKYPFLERVGAIPSNGLVHSYRTRTSIGKAKLVGELGDLTGANAQSVYARKLQANIAVMASRRQISLKAQYAVQHSGMGGAFNLTGPNNLELDAAFTSIANLNQALLFQGNFSGSNAATLDSEDGLYDENGMDGLRYLLKGAGTALNKGSDTFVDVLNKAIGQIINAGGNVDDILIPMSVGARIAINKEFQPLLRVLREEAGGAIPTNLSTGGFVSVADMIAKFMTVPAGAQDEGIGYYTYSSAATEDVNVIDPNGLQEAYLGSSIPVVLELPVGFNNNLSNVYVVFVMKGLVLYVETFHRKVRIPKQTV